MFKRWAALTVSLFLLWIVLSGKFETKFIVAGALCSAVVSLICLPIMRVSKGGRTFFILSVNPLRLLAYLAWLVKEIFFSALDVCKAIIFKSRVAPQIVRFTCRFKNPAATVMLVNSIILTPGTVTVDVTDDDEFLVHALTDGAAEGLLEGGMMRRIARLYGEDLEEVIA